MCILLTCFQIEDKENEFIDVESDDVDNVLNIFDEITAELLKEGEICEILIYVMGLTVST